MANSNLAKAKSAKNDEFYTQYQDIEKEIARLGFNKQAQSYRSSGNFIVEKVG